MGAKESLPVIRRVLVVLEAAAAREDGLTFNEIGTLFPEAPASTVSRLLKALMEENLIAKEEAERRYRLGDAAVRLGRRLCGRLDRVGQIRGVVTELARTIGQSCAYFEWACRAAVLVAKHEMPDAFHYLPEGGRNNHFAKHIGVKMLLAHQPAGTVDDLLEAFPEEGPKDPRRFRDELARIRRADVWIDDPAEQRHIARVAAPVFAEGGIAGVLLATVPSAHGASAPKALARTVRDAAAKATRLLSSA